MGIDSKTTNNGSQTDGQLKENESNSRVEGLAGFGKDYGTNEARMALALADAGVGGGGGGGTTGGTSASTISSGIDGSTSSTRLQSLNTAIGGIGDASVGETSGGSLLSRMRGMHVDLANVDTEVTSIDGRIATTNTSLGEIKTEVESIDTALAGIGTNVGSLDTKLTTTNTNLGTISTSVSDIETNSDAMVTDLAAIEVLATTSNTNTGNIATDVGEIEALIGTSSDDAEDTTVLGKLTAIEEKLTAAPTESTYSDNVYSITNTATEAQAANSDAIEITLQNTGEEVIRLRLGSNPTDTIHWVLPINAILVFSGLKARQSIHASVESTNNTGQLYVTTTAKAAATPPTP